MNTFKNKNSLRTIESQSVQKLKNNEARPKFTGSYKKKMRVFDVSATVDLKVKLHMCRIECIPWDYLFSLF